MYYTRQRVKLRYGGIVDADDIRRGWLLNRIFGNKHFENDQEDEESAPVLSGGDENGNASSQRRSKWGARGISISADDTTLEHEQQHDPNDEISGVIDPDAKMQDPDELARALDDDDDDDDGAAPSGSRTNSNKDIPPGVNNENEWRND